MKRNPRVGHHPDLFEKEGTPVVRDLEDMTGEEITSLPRSAFSDDEWDELDEDLQEAVREGDKESQARIQRMVDEFVNHHKAIIEPDMHYLHERLEEDFDYYFSEAGGDFVGYINDRMRRSSQREMETIFEKFKADGYSEEQIYSAFNEAMDDRDNWDFNYDTDEYHGGFFQASTSESFYMERNDIEDLIEDMYYDEIEAALEEINRETDLSLEAKDLDRKFGIDIEDYVRYFATADPDWDRVSEAMESSLSGEEPEGGEEAEDIEDRIIYRFKDGWYVVDLLPEELPAEGRKRGLCVGSKQYGYAEAIKEGNTKILSMRDADDRRIFTIELRTEPYKYVRQIKADNNALPGVNDLPRIKEFLTQGLGLPWKKIKDIQDLKGAIQASKGLPAPRPNHKGHCGFCAPVNSPDSSCSL